MKGRFAGHRAVVVGFGASGRAAAWALRREGADVRVSEARPAGELGGTDLPEGVPPVEELDVEVLAGGHREEHLAGATLVVASPGVPERADVIGWARRLGLSVWSELELGARLCTVPYVGVTGTNGKTTTVELVAAAMRRAGLRARACGNVGFPFSVAALQDVDALAVEASSFQLVFHHTFRPRVSVLLNLAPDHLDWHGSFDRYAAAKARVFLAQGRADVHVGNAGDPQAAAVSRRAPCETRWFRPDDAPRPGEVGILDGRVSARVGPEPAIDLGAPSSLGAALLADAAAAAAASLAFGLPGQAVGEAIRTYTAPPHRGAVVAQAGSVRFVDDSKATNPHAVLASLEGRSDVVLIAGGLHKGVDLSPLAAAAPRLTGVVAIGTAAPALARLFEGLVPVRRARSMEEAVSTAFGLARSGGTVLLAPACASQDMFRDYRERGDRFAAAARALAGLPVDGAPPAGASTAGARDLGRGRG